MLSATITPSIVHSPLDMVFSNVYYKLDSFLGDNAVFLKLEGINPAGSIKIKPAIEMLTDLERRGVLTPGKNHVVESSSGNLGIALSIVCKIKGYPFTCVTDVNINRLAKRYIELYGGQVIVINKRDENGGFLNSRIEHIRSLLAEHPSYVWLNQYESPSNKLAHYTRTAAEIFAAFSRVDYLFVGAGTTGTLMGCGEYVKRHAPATKLIAVDAVGSVTFGLPPKKRHIPGLGTSRRPELLEPNLVDDLVVISEPDTIATCHEILAIESLLVGGSTGTVLAGVRSYASKIGRGKTVVAISPDFGDRYIETIYDRAWLNENFPSVQGDVPVSTRSFGYDSFTTV